MNNMQKQLETKNLLYLEDSLEHEALAVKKCNMYAQSLTDPALRDLANQLAAHHKAHYTQLFSYLQSHNQ